MALEDTGLLILRLVLGFIFLYHAFPKLAKSGMVAQMMSWKQPLVILLGLLEALAALTLILGFYSRIGALVLAIIMLGAIIMKLFMMKKPFSSMETTGWEFDLILLAAILTIVFVGTGTIAIQPILI
jgi:putative oxidoreductase